MNERHGKIWRVQHAQCAIEHRETVQEKNAKLTPNERTRRQKATSPACPECGKPISRLLLERHLLHKHGIGSGNPINSV